MKRILTVFLMITLLLGMAACESRGVETDYPAAIMVGDVVYFLTGDTVPGIHDSGIVGYTSEYTDTFPSGNGENNFSKESLPYARVMEGIAVFYENEWRLCRTQDDMRENAAAGRKTTEPSSEKDGILETPPALTVCTWDQSVEAMQGTTSWMYSLGGDRWTGIEADSLHPLDDAAKAMMPRLLYTRSMLGHMHSTDAMLRFSTAPDRIAVRCWEEGYWGDPGNDNKAEAVPVTGEDRYITLKEAGYLYEVRATWESHPLYHGTAYYSFYAAPAYEDSLMDGKVTVTSGKRTVHPYAHFAYSREWTEGGFLYADGTPVDGELKEWQEASPLPEIVWSEDFSFDCAEGIDFRYLMVFNEARERQDDLHDSSELAGIKPGKYYIGILAHQDGRYIEQAKGREYAGWVCFFKLIVE